MTECIFPRIWKAAEEEKAGIGDELSARPIQPRDAMEHLSADALALPGCSSRTACRLGRCHRVNHAPLPKSESKQHFDLRFCTQARTHTSPHAHTRTRVNTHTRTDTHAQTCTHARAKAYALIHPHLNTHAHKRARTYTSAHASTQARTHARIEALTHIRTRNHTNARMSNRSLARQALQQ